MVFLLMMLCWCLYTLESLQLFLAPFMCRLLCLFDLRDDARATRDVLQTIYGFLIVTVT